jgi:guanylate kinase
MNSLGRLFIVSAPSGAGKTSLIEAVIARVNPAWGLRRIVTYTSRSPRKGEIPGRDYNYLSSQEFFQKAQSGFFIEWTQGLGHCYGTQKTIIEDLRAGRSGILVIDRPGAAQVARVLEDAILVWIEVPDMATLEKRLRIRGTESEEAIQRRLLRARDEIAEEQEKKLYHFHICNDNFNKAVDELEEIILTGMSDLNNAPK